MHIEKPQQSTPDITSLTPAQREVLARHLTDIDNVDTAFAHYKRTIKEARDAAKSGDEIWSRAANGDANRAEEHWKTLRATTKDLPSELQGVIDDHDLGRKSTREHLRAQLVASHETADTRENNTSIDTVVDQAAEHDALLAQIDTATTAIDHFAQHCKEEGQDLLQVNATMGRAIENVEVWDNSRYYKENRELGDAMKDLGTYLEKITLATDNAREGISEGRPAQDVVRQMITAIDDALRAQEATHHKAELLAPKLIRLATARLYFPERESGVSLPHQARNIQERLASMGIELKNLRQRWMECGELASQQEETGQENPAFEYKGGLSVEQNEQNETLAQDVKETATIMTEGVTQARKRCSEAVVAITRLREEMRASIRISGKTPMANILEAWQTDIGSLEQGFIALDAPLLELTSLDNTSIDRAPLLVKRITDTLNRIDSRMREYTEKGDAVVAEMRQKVAQFSVLRFDGSHFMRTCISARQLQEQAVQALRDRATRWTALQQHLRSATESAR